VAGHRLGIISHHHSSRIRSDDLQQNMQVPVADLKYLLASKSGGTGGSPAPGGKMEEQPARTGFGALSLEHDPSSDGRVRGRPRQFNRRHVW